MLVPFALTLEALDLEVGSELDQTLAFDRMRQVWSEHGVLVLPRDAARDATLKDTLRKLNPRSRKRWQNALRYLPSVKRDTEGAYDQNFMTTSTPIVQRDFELLVLSNEQFAGIEDCSGAYCTIVDGTEVVIGNAVDQASGFKRVKELGLSEISNGASSDAVWNERIAPVARHVSNISIVDRYAMSRFEERGGQSGIARVLTWLSQMPNIASSNEMMAAF